MACFVVHGALKYNVYGYDMNGYYTKVVNCHINELGSNV